MKHKNNAFTIDIIIPAYNPGAFLKGCLQSCLSQTYSKPYRITVIDDGSSEPIEQIVHSFEHLPSHVEMQLITLDQNRGPGHARNVGIENTCGDLLFFHDADDFMCPDRLEVSTAAFEGQPQLMMVCGNWRWIVDGKLEGSPRFLHPPKIEYTTLLFDLPISGQTVSLKRSVLERTGLFNEDYIVAEDYDLWARVLKHYPTQIKYIDREMVHHNRYATPYSLSKNYMWTPRHYAILSEMKKKYGMV